MFFFSFFFFLQGYQKSDVKKLDVIYRTSVGPLHHRAQDNVSGCRCSYVILNECNGIYQWSRVQRERESGSRLISHVGGISMCPNELSEATSISSDVMLKWKLIVQYGSTQMPRVSHNPYHVAWPNECILIDVGRGEKLISSVIRVLKITIKWNSGMDGKEKGETRKKIK